MGTLLRSTRFNSQSVAKEQALVGQASASRQECSLRVAAAQDLRVPDASGATRLEDLSVKVDCLKEQVGRIEEIVLQLLEQRTVKGWYTTEEVARMLGKAEFTVREWCRNGRVHAEKKGSGRGKYQSWVISHAELQRLQKEGLLPTRSAM
jgi:Helix-turn-helix domain